MSKKKMTPAQKAAARRSPAADGAPKAIEKKERSAKTRNLASKYERRTKRIISTVQVVLVVIPVAMIAFTWFMNGGTTDGLQEAMAKDPQLTIGFISAMCQPLVAWLLRFVQRHYEQGDGGYAAGNLIALVCGELMLQFGDACFQFGDARLVFLLRICQRAHGAQRKYHYQYEGSHFFEIHAFFLLSASANAAHN